MGIELQDIYNMVDQMPGNYMVFGCDITLKYLYYTKDIPALSGMTKEEYDTVENFYNFIFEEDRFTIQNKVQTLIDNKEFEENDLLFRLFHKTQGFLWIHMTMKEFANINGQIIMVVHLVEVTKEMMIAYSLMETSNRFICVIEKATKRFLYANQGFYDLIDSNPADAMGKHCYELLCKAMEMKDNDNCLCYSGIDADPPIEYYNPEKKMYLTLTGKETKYGEYNAYVFYLTDITEKKRKDEMLEDSRRRFNVALDNSELMIWEYDMVNHRCINSEKAGRDYNIPLVIENYPESLFETGHVPPETIEQIKDVRRRLQNGESGFFVERRTIKNDGSSEWQKVEYTLECDENGKPIRAIACGLDITAQKELEKKYEEQMEYRNKFAQNAMFSIRLDLDADIVIDYTCTNPQIEEIVHGMSKASDALDAFFKTSEFKEESNITKERLSLNALKETYAIGQSQYQTIYRCTLLDLFLDLNLTIYKNPGTGHLEVFYVVIDVTENILKENALQSIVTEDYDFLAMIDVDTGKMMLLASSKDAVLPRQYDENPDDYDEIMLQFAREYHDIYYSKEDYYLVSEGMRLSKIKEKLAISPNYEFNCKVKDSNGATLTFRLSFRYKDERKNQIIFTRANITHVVREEQKNQAVLEKALERAKSADQAKTDFLSRMSHDMRTPMNGIIGMTHLTKQISNLPKEVQENLDAINESSLYLLQLINDTLDMNKIESNRFTLKPEIVHIENMIKYILSTIEPLTKRKKIQFDFTRENVDFEYIYVDKVRMQQLVINILSNAVKFTQEGGHISLTIDCQKKEKGLFQDRIIVEDNGRGMSPEFLEHIFEPFSQEKNEMIQGQEGTGLGMSIVKNLVEQIGGNIKIQSKVGKGTKIIVSMNFQRVYDVPEEVEQYEKLALNLKDKKVLLVEDHPLNARISIKLLEQKGMKVVLAKNGQIAVDLFMESTRNEFDIILMDIRMPVMNGLDATRMIRNLERMDAKKIPIIAMTANAYDDDIKMAFEAGMNEYISKPVEPETMFKTISKALKDEGDKS